MSTLSARAKAIYEEYSKDPVRVSLTKIRKQYNQNPIKLIQVTLASFAVTTLGGILMDMFLPYYGWGNIVRSLWLVPASGTMFVIMYAISLFLHNSKVRGDQKWVPYRFRYSQKTRIEYSVIFIVLVGVSLYATGFRVGFTFVSSFIGACMIACVVFCRSTRNEHYDQSNDLKDVRDIAVQERIKKNEEQRQKALEEKKERKKNRHGPFIKRRKRSHK